VGGGEITTVYCILYSSLLILGIKERYLNVSFSILSPTAISICKQHKDYAFCHCCSLRFIRLAPNLEYFGSSFRDCKSLEAVYLPDRQTHPLLYAFFDYCRLTASH